MKESKHHQGDHQNLKKEWGRNPIKGKEIPITIPRSPEGTDSCN